MSPEDLKTGLAIGGAALSILVSMVTLFKARRDRAKAGEAEAVKEALRDKKVTELETSVTALRAELDGVKSGFEAGIVRVQDSLHGVVEMLTKLQITVAILVDRDDREQPARPEIILTEQPKPSVPRRPRRAKGLDLG